jgi:hypothetical protein
VDRLTRVQLARGAALVFAATLVGFWIALRIGGAARGAERWLGWGI